MLLPRHIFAFLMASSLFLAGCVFPIGGGAEIEIDPIQPYIDESRVRHYQRQGMDEDSARRQVAEDRFFEEIEQRRRTEQRQRYQESQRQGEFENRLRESLRNRDEW